MRAAIAIAAVVIGAAIARAGHAPARVDWASGLVSARAVGIADRHAPSPAVARGTSRRVAENLARERLRAAIAELPVAGGGTVRARASDPAVAARLDRAVAAAFPVAAEPQTDGSWHVTMAVPIEAVRQALVGPRALPRAGDAGPPVVVVDGVTAKPAVGWKIGRLGAATVWVHALPAYAKGAPRVRARRARHGTIELAKQIGGAATLYVIVAK